MFLSCLLLLARKWDERDISAALHRNGDLTLVPGTISRNTTRKDLSALGYEEPERFDVLVVDEGGLVHAEAADLFPDLESPAFVAATASAVIITIPAFTIGAAIS